MENPKHNTTKSTVQAAQTGKKISKGLVKFYMKGGDPVRKTISELKKEAEDKLKKE